MSVFCCACGVYISYYNERLFIIRDIEDDDKLSESFKDTASRQYWPGIYRAIIKYEEQPIFLSGTARFGLPHYCGNQPLDYDYPTRGVPLCVPLGRHEVAVEPEEAVTKRGKRSTIIDRRREIYTANMWNDQNQDVYPHGFAVHAYCWSMIERIIGPLAEKKLDLFFKTLHERWQERPFEIETCVDGRTVWRDEDPDTEKLLPEALVATADPGDVPEIKDIIHKATEQAVRKRRMKKPKSQAHFDLPLDIQRLILDCLRPRDARNALTGMGWQVPLSYWKTRCPRGLTYVHEINNDKLKKLDQEFLYQEIEELLEGEGELSYRWQNRKRIFRILEGTRDLFFSHLAERGIHT